MNLFTAVRFIVLVRTVNHSIAQVALDDALLAVAAEILRFRVAVNSQSFLVVSHATR